MAKKEKKELSKEDLQKEIVKYIQYKDYADKHIRKLVKIRDMKKG